MDVMMPLAWVSQQGMPCQRRESYNCRVSKQASDQLQGHQTSVSLCWYLEYRCLSTHHGGGLESELNPVGRARRRQEPSRDAAIKSDGHSFEIPSRVILRVQPKMIEMIDVQINTLCRSTRSVHDCFDGHDRCVRLFMATINPFHQPLIPANDLDRVSSHASANPALFRRSKDLHRRHQASFPFTVDCLWAFALRSNCISVYPIYKLFAFCSIGTVRSAQETE